MPTPIPTDIKLRKSARELVVSFDDGAVYHLPFEYLRVFSPSAEVRGHGPGEPLLVTGKADVTITRIEQVGNYAIKLVFSDGHDTGIYSWNVLHELGYDQEKNMARYRERVAEHSKWHKA
ncbi:MAG TPA: DUF971 domain-containing protein [Gammaproteobacteria bacterium]|nr:DUF971 domain-containing protein [Gammaproteobacteria bacterium]